jgi:hypothetical protein
MNDITIKVYSNWIQAHNLNHYKKMSNRIKKVPVVTSVSRHIGIESSLLLSKNGFRTYASRRNLEKSINTLKVADMENFLLDRQGQQQQQQQHVFVQESR